MIVDLKIFLPALSEVIGCKHLQVEFAGETVNDLFEHLIARYGRQVVKALYTRNGEMDPIIQVLLNGTSWVPHDRFDTILQDGDEVMIMVMIAGG